VKGEVEQDGPNVPVCWPFWQFGLLGAWLFSCLRADVSAEAGAPGEPAAQADAVGSGAAAQRDGTAGMRQLGRWLALLGLGSSLAQLQYKEF